MQNRKIVVIGGVAAGPKAASRARRIDQNADITIIEREEILSYSGCGLPYWISGVVKEKKELTSTATGTQRDPIYFAKVKNIRALNRTEAVEIDRNRRSVLCRRLETGEILNLPYDNLIIATGSIPVDIKIPGSDLKNVTHLKNLQEAANIREALASCSKVAIIGGGFIGCEMAEAICECAKQATIVEMMPHLLPGLLDEDMALLLEKSMREQGVVIHTNTKVVRLDGNEEGQVQKIVTHNGIEIDTEFVLLAVGVRPVVDLAKKAGIAIGNSGGIKVDSHMQTSDPEIYAAGDCVEHFMPLLGEHTLSAMGSIANKEGRVAGTNAAGGDIAFRGIVGTNVLKVFGTNVGRTGLTNAGAIARGMKTVTAVVASSDRAHYYPGSSSVILKAVVEAGSRRLVGLQGIGTGEVAKRIDVGATAITGQMTIDEVADLDLGYAPPYSQAMDPLITLANMARNKLDGLLDGISVTEVKKRIDSGDDLILLDVRDPAEFESMRLPGSDLIPLSDLRGRISELPKNREIVIICRAGLRAYEAARILKGEGYNNVKVMEGGVLAWPYPLEMG